MSETTPKMPSGGQEVIPPWRDIRVLGVVAQIAFVIVVVWGFAWIVNNVLGNLDKLGGSQFLCRDGSTSYRCAFDFLRLDAQFDITETSITYDPSDSYSRALLVGLLNTLKVTVFGVILATVLGTIAGIARLSSNWLVASIAKWYVDIMRNTPLLLQLFFLYFGVILAFPAINQAIQPFGLPIYLSQRGINLPSLVFMPSSAVWIAFVFLALIQAQVLWVLLGRREERTGRPSNRVGWTLLSLVVVAVAGWYVASSTVQSQAILVPQSLGVRQFSDLEAVMQRRLAIENLADVEQAVTSGRLTSESVDEAAYRICVVRDDPAEVNLTSQLQGLNIPYTVQRSSRLDQATDAYGEGACDLFVADKAILAGERNALPEPALQRMIPVAERPVRISMPRIEGLNFIGGAKLSPNFAAILIGLVLYTGAFIAEIVRAGIQAVPKGQSEAARALGLNESQRLRLVVLPQALRVIIPPTTSQYLNLAKNSSLAIAVGYDDLWRISFTTLNQSGRPIQIFLIVMGAYLSLSLTISFFLNWYNRRIALVER
jgi:general L-amino acid transport system permease protein